MKGTVERSTDDDMELAEENDVETAKSEENAAGNETAGTGDSNLEEAEDYDEIFEKVAGSGVITLPFISF